MNATTSAERTIHIAILLIAVWLLGLAWFIDVETADGYASVSNAQFFLGNQSDYFFQRAPLVSILLIPAELIANSLNLHPLDLRPHHYTLAIVHIIYLIMVWRWMARTFGSTWPSAIAYSISVFSFTFFSYAPFINIDIFPGAIFLGMILLTIRFIEKPKLGLLVTLMLLGLVSVLVKQTYALFWVAILVSAGALKVFFTHEHQFNWSIWWQLAFASFLSGIFSWLIFAAHLSGGPFNNYEFLLRPLYLIDYVSNLYHDQDLSSLFPWWLYFRNFHLYGLAAALLLIPGILSSLRSKNRLHIMVALCWLFCFAAMLLINFKEIRYLAYLSPLTAFLLVKPIEKLLSRGRLYFFAIAAVFSLDFFLIATETIQYFDPFYRQAMSRFFKPLDDRDMKDEVLVVRGVSLLSPIPSPAQSDRYHRIFHLTAEEIRTLYGIETSKFRNVTHPWEASLNQLKTGMIVLYSNNLLARQPPWNTDNTPNAVAGFFQLSGKVESIILSRDPEGFRTNFDKESVWLLFPDESKTGTLPQLSNGEITLEQAKLLYGDKSSSSQISTLGVRIINFCWPYCNPSKT